MIALLTEYGYQREQEQHIHHPESSGLQDSFHLGVTEFPILNYRVHDLGQFALAVPR